MGILMMSRTFRIECCMFIALMLEIKKYSGQSPRQFLQEWVKVYAVY